MIARLIRLIVAALSICVLAQAPVALAQSTYGSITGTVSDSSGAVISNAKVQIANQSTGVVRTVQTDDVGNYNVVNLDAGAYTVTVSAAGMEVVTRKDVPLLAREIVREDFQLGAAGVSQQVVVKSESTTIDQSLTISDSKSGNEINALALNFRATNATSPIVVANLAPGVQPDPSGNISVAGGLPNSTSFSIDGISTQQVRFGGPNVDMFPSVESIAEFKVNTAANDAEFSQPTDLTVTSKSGGNDYHGTGFWFFQRDALDAKDPFATVKPSVQADDFGGSFSGPLTIPKLYEARNKTFFFFTYEGTRRPQDFLLNEIVPPAAWRTGDFSSLKETFTNPLTGQPFANNQIPVNPVSARILNTFFASPNAGSPTSAASPNFTANFPGNFTVNDYDGRLDHNITDNQKVYFRISNKEIVSSGTDGTSTYNTQLGTNSSDTSLLNLSGSHNWIIKSNLVNEFRAGYTSAEYAFNNYPLAAQGQQIVQNLGITGLPGVPKNGLGGVSNFSISGFLGGASSPGHPRDIKNHTLELSDNISWLKGSHSFKFGFEFMRMDYEDQITFLIGDEFGDYTFDGSITGGTDPAHALADFLLGYPVQASFAQNGPDGKPYGYHYGGFAQDTWKIRRNLTLSYGLRYEVNPAFNDATHQLGQ
ncbi:MAG TPA: TonB-dependent receptor, partial [Blastocatellia bacterium]|nr:TonB-dependent receptor [Blastocatellia bacterium]